MVAIRICVFVRLLALLVGVAGLLPEDQDHSGTSPNNLEPECAARCPDLDLNQSRTDDSNSGVECGVRCKVDQCTKGCAVWQLALDTNCTTACNATQNFYLPPKELYCVVGCYDALDKYFQQLKEEIGTPPAPALVADSLTATSLRLEWKGIDIERRGGGISYLVQWIYEEIAGTWQYCRNQSWGKDDQILVDNLQPYTKYRFRVALMLKSPQPNREPIVSAPSVPIQTEAEGLPSSAPVIVRAAAVDSCRISVSWEPGPFPNGPLLSYVLRLQGANSQLKDISASENATDHHYMFQNLEPDKNYSVSITMRNSKGEGPPATVRISTRPARSVTETQQPILIIGCEHTVKKQVSNMIENPTVIYETTNLIRGVAIHVASKQVFVSDSAGYVYRAPIDDKSEPVVVLSPDQVNFQPLGLSVDWLNLHLYVLGEVRHSTTSWQIARCNFDGRSLTVAFAGVRSKPTHIEVDPSNGYLFWINEVGLYKLDLADISNGVKHETQPDLVDGDPFFGAFIVDHMNFRLLVPQHVNNTVVSLTLDGREVSNLRNNTQQPRFENVVSLAMANGLFYWTNGKGVLTEDYHSASNTYFHNFYSDKCDGSCVSVNVLMDASQPAPVPVNPPTNVQAILGAHMAKVSWGAPYLLGGQGRGAWQNWSYELEIKDEVTGEAIHQKDIAGSSHTVHQLRERSEYSIKAAAYTTAGRGPWSTEFSGRSLRDPKGGPYASILWSATEGLMRSDVTGENVQTLIHRASWKDSEMEYPIMDVAWYEDLLYLVGNNSILYSYNTTSQEKNRLHINSVGSVAIDWISKKLYWANPNQLIITRANLNGTQQEPLSILAHVKKLMIDSVEAYLYLATEQSVEASRLNGQDRRFYYSDKAYIGKQVMGMTLDTENKFVYWIIRSFDSGTILYRAPTAERIPLNQKIVVTEVSTLRDPHMQGSLCHFSEHLLWLRDDKKAVIGDLSGQNTAVLNQITQSGPQMVTIIDHAVHKFPKNLSSDTIIVLPSAVNVNGIRIEGYWNKFNVSWDPVTNINYGTVFYEVMFVDHINTNANPEVTKETTIPYNNSDRFSPYAVLEVTVKAFTYWGTSQNTRKTLRSPQSEPTQPTNTRAFVEFQTKPLSNETDISAVFRWDQPDHANGVILGYNIECWLVSYGMKRSVCDNVDLTSSNLEHKVDRLERDTTYYFRVRAYTEVGAGGFSDEVSISTESEYPVPQILVATLDAVRISDLDRGSNDTITRQIAIEVAYSAAENKIYWINEMHEMVVADKGSTNATKILALNNTATSLCVDWVTRTLFWTEPGNQKGAGSQIMRLDFTAWKAGYTNVKKLLRTKREAVTLDISPLTGKLYWIESTSKNRGVIMQSDVYGGNVQHFFNHSEDCSCPYRPFVRPVMTVDNTDVDNPMIYWVSAEGHLQIADIDGCACNIVISSTDPEDSDKGLPPTSLTVDKINVYWSNMDQDRVYYVNKIHSVGTKIQKFHLQSARSLKAIGRSLQPYPTADCLVPRPDFYRVEPVEELSNSIRVKLPEAQAHDECHKYNLPATRYTIYVTECASARPENCGINERVQLQTYENEIEAKNLRPFTKYMFQLGLSNYYSDLQSSPLELGPGIIIRTGAGVPTKPENVSVEALTPTLVSISWLPPKVLNGASVRYEIHWKSVQLVNGVRQKGEQLIKLADQPKNGNLSTTLQPLLPGQEYDIFVRAYPANSTGNYSESSGQKVTMFPEPSDLIKTGVSVNALNLTWVRNKSLTVGYHLEFSVVGLDKWQIAGSPIKLSNDKVEFRLTNLHPRTVYKFRFILRYPRYDNFIWPQDARFTFETLGAVPSAPGSLTMTQPRDSIYVMSWEPAQAHGSQVTLYRLEGRVVEPSSEEDGKNRSKTGHWNLCYNGTDNSWIIPGDMSHKYQFRVKARNAYGFGAWSEPSEVVDLGDAVPKQHLALILGLSVPLILSVMLLCFGFYLCPIYRQRKEDKKTVIPPTMPDVELATLREIPRGNFIQSNALYASAIQNDPDDSALPKIKREQITLAKFLGSGAFGEVFQGNAKDLDGPGITGVAIKTLRKGASAQEKTEFLQEARLMSHFRHKHVLRLLGVCLDTDPPLLVLELMKAGDLLTYLRASRPLQPTDPGALRLQDLLAMCEDVARGCRYLEERHFVHRDLACRNCLVSARDRENRVVKIGDFGLARDIYKNDYYRKEGEGLLPVRWMAPESLVDGVFTSQSDVWAFGVIMWEITSVGQQPYPARTNLEVLYHVRAGGRLSKPLNCPAALHQLMLRCWSTADARPSFKACLDHIITLRSATDDAILSPVHAGHYLSKRGVSNMAYFADENQNHNESGNSWKSSSSEGSRDMQPFLPDSCNSTVLLSPNEIPKYLELLADNEVPDIRDPTPIGGYEVPRLGQTSDKNDTQKGVNRTETSDQQQTETTAVSLDGLEETISRKRASISSVADKGIVSEGPKPAKSDKLSPEVRGSLTSLSGRSISSHGSSASLASTTRPSSSLINSHNQNTLPLKKNGNKRNSFASELQNGKNTISKLNRTHSILQNGKANIPLALNSALLNSLRQTPSANEEVSDVVTYTNINSDAVRVNG